MNNVRISVIVPIYNAEKYLYKCLDSLINQTFKEIEIICIDDCSTDGSMDIVKKYANKDSRIKVIASNKNQGQGLIRNTGLKIATGDYISFIDSDDWVDLDCFEVCYSKLVSCDLDIICFGARNVGNDYIGSDIIGLYDTRVQHSINLDRLTIFDYYVNNISYMLKAVWNRIYKKTFLISNKIEFLDMLYEDMIFSIKVHYYAKSYMIIPHVFYNYYYRLDSTMRLVSDKHITDTVLSMVAIRDFLLSNGEYDKYADIFFKNIFIPHLAYFFSRVNSHRESREKLRLQKLVIDKLNGYNLMNEMLVCLSLDDVCLMFNAFDISKQRDSLIIRKDSLIKRKDDLVKQIDGLVKKVDNIVNQRDNCIIRYENLYYSEWATFGRLRMIAKIFYLVKKTIKTLVKCCLKVFRR